MSARGTTAALAALAAAALSAAPASAASRAPTVRVLTPDQATALQDGAIRVRVTARRPAVVRVTASVPGKTRRLPVVRSRLVHLGAGHPLRRTVRLGLTKRGGRALGRCAARVTIRAGGGVARLACPHPEVIGPRGPDEYEVGIGVRAINPDADGTWHGQKVFLGGYGFGGGGVASAGRPATGILGDGSAVRAIAISDGAHPYVMADIEAQGWFAQTRGGRGIIAMRRAATAALRRAGADITTEQVHVQSDHSHGGIDAMGVWGGIPDGYARFVSGQVVDAIVEAWTARRPGRLYYGAVDGSALLSNQFDYDAAHGNDVVDGELRVLQARTRKGTPFATLMNFSAHATVLGSDNTKATGDWPHVANALLEKAFGGRAMTMVGTLGRTQPRERGDEQCRADPATAAGDAFQQCKLDAYATRVVDRAKAAAAAAQPLGGDPVVAARSYLIEDPSTSVVILGLEIPGDLVGIPFDRALTPPWQAGNVLGSVVSVARIGDVLLSAAPGEMYPQIPLAVRAIVKGMRGYMTAGLADDQLGYLIAPLEAYPEPISRTLFKRDPLDGDGLPIEPLSNDNYLFNVSHTLGERVTCALLRGADDLLHPEASFRGQGTRCGLYATDLAFQPGDDDRLAP